MSKKLFFVEYIHNSNDNNGTIEVLLEDVLHNSQNNNAGRGGFQHITLNTPPVFNGTTRQLEEGHYVYFDGKSFLSAQNDSIAVKRRRENAALRRKIIKQSANQSNAGPTGECFTDKATVYSYHVNVGHGNCTMLLIQKYRCYELLVVDCGEYDYIESHSYQKNIFECLNDIAGKIGKPIDDIRVSKLMITHWHFDHISGIELLIRKGVVDSNTILFANMYYGHSSGCVNKLLGEFVRMKTMCYEPVTSLKIFPTIRILYPAVRLRRMPSSKISGFRIEKIVNNSSVVYSLEFAGKRMILPGDLEKSGWNSMTCGSHCCTALNACDYYCVSHHGSINGHIDIKCMSKSAKKVMSCCMLKLKHAILMGRNGAYRGIYGSTVITSWDSYLRVSENAPHYLLLNWQTDNIIAR